MADDNSSFFKKKRVGFGYSPSGAGGWLIVVLIVAAIIGITVALRH